ncbi:L-type lectin-domain containing receptor kinase IV.1-like [Iris pallida]|uniref:L-type lectin-domain containing receptor kinase IV.1-like n=1 Tax=Iris pallida TaxID=29817 RepID=A0AAX6HTC8_IRIPA|nr:L-type lectin-domain containing receptor kinase IV.1-like [Iris pallida]
MLKFKYAGVSSGNAASPSKNCITCRMPGLAAGNGCEHSSPSLSTSSISATENSSRSLGSHVVSTDPFFQFSSTQSTSTIGSDFNSMGLLPQATSRRNAPKENTSVAVVAFPVLPSSGAM